MPAAKKKKFRIRIRTDSEEALADLPLDEMDRAGTGGVREQPDGTFELEAIVSDSVLKKVEKGERYRVEVLADLDEEAKKKQRQVGKGNRFEGEDWIPRGLGKKVRDGGEQ